MTITDIIKVARDLSDADATSYPAVVVATETLDILGININSAIETIVSKIQEASDFPFDDENFANIAEGTIDLEEGIAKYTITDRFRHILEVKVKDVNGYYNIVEPISQMEDSIIVETEEALTGLPIKYRMVGRTIFFRPSPTATMVTLTAGGLIKYTRTSYQITYADINTGTLIPGIDTAYHPLIAKITALPYCKKYKPARVAQLERDIFTDMNDCVKFYAKRLKGKRNIITNKSINFR